MAHDDLTGGGDDPRRTAGGSTLEDHVGRGSTGTGRSGDSWRDEEAMLRRDMDERRERISDTVNQIEYRVRPGYIWARRRASARQRLTGWKDAVFGSHEHSSAGGNDRDGAGLLERGQQHGGEAAHAVAQAPTAMRRQARGNPLGAGAVALGAGWLIGSLLPESRRERELASRVEPKLAETAAAAREEVSDAAESVRGAARDAAERVKDAGRDAVDDVRHHAQDTAHSGGERSDPGSPRRT